MRVSLRLISVCRPLGCFLIKVVPTSIFKRYNVGDWIAHWAMRLPDDSPSTIVSDFSNKIIPDADITINKNVLNVSLF